MNRFSPARLDYLDEEGLAFIKRLVMASGSLKEVAAGYGISYPTVRLRLDRLIAKITITDSQAIQSEFERLLRTQHVEGKSMRTRSRHCSARIDWRPRTRRRIALLASA